MGYRDSHLQDLEERLCRADVQRQKINEQRSLSPLVVERKAVSQGWCSVLDT